jgi:hypothetical protein
MSCTPHTHTHTKSEITHTHKHKHTHIQTHTSTHTLTHTLTHTQTLTHTHTNKHSHTNTHARTLTIQTPVLTLGHCQCQIKCWLLHLGRCPNCGRLWVFTPFIVLFRRFGRTYCHHIFFLSVVAAATWIKFGHRIHGGGILLLKFGAN